MLTTVPFACTAEPARVCNAAVYKNGTVLVYFLVQATQDYKL